MPRKPYAAVASCALVALAGRAHAQHDVIGVGEEHGGRLGAHIGFTRPFPIHESEFPNLPGYATFDLAFESLAHGEGHLMPLTGGDIRVRLISIDDGLSLYDGLNLINPGSEITLGPPFFHYLPGWVIEPGPAGGEFGANLMLRDASGMHADSEVFRVTFTPIPTPAPALFALVATGLLATRRRR